MSQTPLTLGTFHSTDSLLNILSDKNYNLFNNNCLLWYDVVEYAGQLLYQHFKEMCCLHLHQGMRMKTTACLFLSSGLCTPQDSRLLTSQDY
jgi:hypothetical protein